MCVAYSHPEMCCLHVFFLYHYSVGWDGPAPDVSLDDETPVEVPNTRNQLNQFCTNHSQT